MLLPSLRVNFGWTLAGYAVYAGSQWAILVAIARLAGPEAVGRFALGTAVTTPVFLFAGLQLRVSQATDAARRFDFPDYLGVRLAGMAAALVATAALASAFEHDSETRLVVLAVGATKAIEGVSDIYYGLLQQNERMRPIAASLMWRGVLSVIVVVAALWARGGLLLAVVALAVAWLAVLLAHDSRAATSLLRTTTQPLLPRLRWPIARRIVATYLPLGLVIVLVSFRNNVPRYLIEHRLGTAELGVFAALSAFVASGNLIIMALGQSATPRMARLYFESDVAAFRRLIVRLFLLAAVVGGAGVAVAMLVGKALLLLVFGPAYGGRVDVLVWLMVAGLVAYAASFVGHGLSAARRFSVQLPLFAITAASCAAASAWLVPGHGLVGAAWAWGGSLLLEFVVGAAILSLALRNHVVHR
jgi:O-antigen/teichoic acid export membrane protein